MSRSLKALLIALALLIPSGCAAPTIEPTPTASPPSPTPIPTLAVEAPAPTPGRVPSPTPQVETIPSSSPGLEPAPQVGHPAPDFTLPDLNGQQVSLSGLRGKVVILNFWATWCLPCRVEMPEFELAYRKWKERGVVILGIDVMEDRALVDEAVAQMGLTFPILLDQQAQVAQSYLVLGYPTTFLIDQQGVIQGIKMGPLSGAALEGALEAFAK